MGRIDVHCHHLPDFYRASLEEHGDELLIPEWSPELAIAFMDRYDIDVQVVSISTPACTHLDGLADRIDLARRLNTWTAEELVHTSDPARAGRFGAYAVLPLGPDPDEADVEAARIEAVHAVKVLGLDGVGLLSSYGSTYSATRCSTPCWAPSSSST